MGILLIPCQANYTQFQQIKLIKLMNKAFIRQQYFQLCVSQVIHTSETNFPLFYLTFENQQNRNIWQSPHFQVHPNLQNNMLPWKFVADTNKFIVNLYAVEEGENQEDQYVIGATPLILIKKEGEENIDIFERRSSKKGSKIAEINLQYRQVTVADPSQNSKNNYSFARSGPSSASDQPQKISVQNIGSRKGSFGSSNDLMPIPEESNYERFISQHQNIQSSTYSRESSNLQTLDSQNLPQIIPKTKQKYKSNPKDQQNRIQYLQARSQKQQIVSEHEQSGMSLLKQIQTTDQKWYRYLFGKQKPNQYGTYQKQQSLNNDLIIKYQTKHKYLKEESYEGSHIELSNINLKVDRQLKQMKIGKLNLEQSLKAEKIVTIKSNKEIRQKISFIKIKLPHQCNNCEIQIATKAGSKLRGILKSKESNPRITVNLFDNKGVETGYLSLSIKHINNIEIQTQQLMKSMTHQNEQENIQEQKNPQKSGANKILQKQRPNNSVQSSSNDILQTGVKIPMKMKNEQKQKWVGKLQMSLFPWQLMTNNIYLKPDKPQFRKNKFQQSNKKQKKFNTQSPIASNKRLTNKIYQKAQSEQQKQKQLYISNKTKEKKSYLISEVTESRKSKNIQTSNTNKIDSIRKVQYFQKYDKVIPFQEPKQDKNVYNLEEEDQPLTYPFKNSHNNSLKDQSKQKIFNGYLQQQLVRDKYQDDNQENKNQRNKYENIDRCAIENSFQQVEINKSKMQIVNNIIQAYIDPSDFSPKEDLRPPKNFNNYPLKSHTDRQMQRNQNELFGSRVKKTKYSSKTTQPLPSSLQLQFMILAITANLHQNVFGNKFIVISSTESRCKYQTDSQNTSNNLIWKCQGFVFKGVSFQQDILVQLYLQVDDKQFTLCEAFINSRQFKNNNKLGIVRAQLRNQEGEPVGQVVLIIQNIVKKTDLTNKGEVFRQSRDSRQRVNKSLQLNLIKHKTQGDEQFINRQYKSVSKSKNTKLKKNRSNNLTSVKKKSQKQDQTTRHMMNEHSKARIQSRVNPIRQRRYTGGKSIFFGKDSRFPLTPEDQLHKNSPGPGSYELDSEFNRYSRR